MADDMPTVLRVSDWCDTAQRIMDRGDRTMLERLMLQVYQAGRTDGCDCAIASVKHDRAA